MVKSLPELSKNEWAVMKWCWDVGKCTARNVYEKALEERTWEYQTVKTMLDRLAKKGYLKRDKIGPICLFEPRVSRAASVRKAVDSFAETVLDEAVAPLFVHLAKGRKLNNAEIASLRKLIEQHEEDRKQ